MRAWDVVLSFVDKVGHYVRIRLHYFRMRRLLKGSSPSYQDYLLVQFRRSYRKRNRNLQLHTRIIIDALADIIVDRSNASVLAIGSRNGEELAYFRKSGFTNSLGIDVFSIDPSVLVMDMHAMRFPDDHFDVVYAAHSLEHAYDVQRVRDEIVRVATDGAIVAIEVPIQFKRTKIDLVDFGSKEAIHELFEPNLDQIHMSEQLPPLTERNAFGSAVARTVFSIRKTTGIMPNVLSG